MTHPEPPWIPYSPGDPVPMGMVRAEYSGMHKTEYVYFDRLHWPAVTAYQRHPNHQLIADMRDDLVMTLNVVSGNEPHRALILRAEAIVGRAPGLPDWLVEYLDGGKE